MIHLDTNYLVALSSVHYSGRERLLAWLRSGEEFATSAIAWSEFLNGPATSREIQDATNLLQSRILSFTVAEASVAASLFNQSGRRRGSIPDCCIAATAICARQPLATNNQKDFARFTAMGLLLV